MGSNPYEAPKNDAAPARTPQGWVACPQCGGIAATMPSFTWWGGVIGAKMLTHVICDQCKHAYNGKTGGSNTGMIVVYSAVLAVIAFGIMYAIQ